MPRNGSLQCPCGGGDSPRPGSVLPISGLDHLYDPVRYITKALLGTAVIMKVIWELTN